MATSKNDDILARQLLQMGAFSLGTSAAGNTPGRRQREGERQAARAASPSGEALRSEEAGAAVALDGVGDEAGGGPGRAAAHAQPDAVCADEADGPGEHAATLQATRLRSQAEQAGRSGELALQQPPHPPVCADGAAPALASRAARGLVTGRHVRCGAARPFIVPPSMSHQLCAPSSFHYLCCQRV